MPERKWKFENRSAWPTFPGRAGGHGSTNRHRLLIFGAVAKKIDCTPVLKALSDQTRWRIVRALLEQSLTVNELTARVDATQYNVSKHLRILRAAGLVTTRREGKAVRCTVDPAVRRKLTQDKTQLDLGCCTFQFD